MGACPRFFLRYHSNVNYQAKLSAPFGVLGIRCSESTLTGIDFLSAGEEPQRATGVIAEIACEQLLQYLGNPEMQFSIPLELKGTAHQLKVWQALLVIPRGQTRCYGELATELRSCAQAIGQVCGANPIPIIIPCHRVIGKAGLGGFMKHADGDPLNIKRWLLAHESMINESS